MRVEPRHRLVEDQQLGIVDERLGEPRSLHHALREAPHRLIAAARSRPTSASSSRVRSRRRAAAQAEQPADVVEVLGGRQVVVEVGVLGQVAGAIAPRRARRAARRGPWTSPRSGRSSPISSFSVVVLPEPFGPT